MRSRVVTLRQTNINGDILEVMAMNLRLTDDEADTLRLRAEREGRSMQDLARSAVRDCVERTSKRELLDQVPNAEPPRYAEALRRIGERSSSTSTTRCTSRVAYSGTSRRSACRLVRVGPCPAAEPRLR